MLIVSKKGTNGGYRGRFHQRAVDLVKSGTRVGIIHVGPEDARLRCHVCGVDFDKPSFDPGERDAWSGCPICKTPFVFDKVG